MKLQYKTRGMSDPKGKPKVYFSSHPEDFNEALPLITEDLLKHANCAVFYDEEIKSAEPSDEETEDIRDHYFSLSEEDQDKDWKPFNSMLKLLKKFDGLRIYKLD